MLPIEQKDILSYRFLSGLRFAPGGGKAAFVVANANEEENCYERRLWLYEHHAIRQLTDLGKESAFVWLDENRLLFPAVRSAKEKKRAEAKEDFTAYYVLDVRGGEALPFMTLPMQVSTLRVLDETHFLVTADVDKRHPDLWNADEETRKKVRAEREADADYEVFDELPFWGNGQGVTNGSRSSLFLVGLEPFRVTAVTAPPEEVSAVAILGDEVLYAVTRWERKLRLGGFKLRALNWKTGMSRSIRDHATLRPEGMEVVGDKVLLPATEAQRHGLNENAWVYTIDPTTGEIDLLRMEEYNMYNSVGSDCRLGGNRQRVAADGALYHLTTRGGNAYLHRLNPDGTDVPVFTGAGSVDGFDVDGGRFLIIGLFDMLPQELYEYDPAVGRLVRVSHFHDDALDGRYVARPEPLTVHSRGYEIEGWVLRPRDFDPAKKYPAVLDVHGGPKTVYGPVFYHEMQVWASLGYFVFFCNPKGSDGGTNVFMDIRGHYGDTDYANLMDFTDAVLAAWPQIDAKRVCETGGSYGGFMTNWIIGHTDRFVCAASQRSISNWLSFYGISDIGFYFAEDQCGGNIYDNAEKLWSLSPLRYARNVRTPTLFIHSDEDYRCPLEQGLQMYAALVDRGVEARLCLFHGENHELSRSGKPTHRLRRLKEITDWFEQHVRRAQLPQ